MPLPYIPSFTGTVSALTYSLLGSTGAARAADGQFIHNRVCRYVLSEHARMPDYLRLPMHVLTLVFDAQTLLFGGLPFHALPPERRMPWIERWRRSRLGPCRDFVRFHESLAAFAGFDAVYPPAAAKTP